MTEKEIMVLVGYCRLLKWLKYTESQNAQLVQCGSCLHNPITVSKQHVGAIVNQVTAVKQSRISYLIVDKCT